MAVKKNISKSIRISEEVFSYIDSSPGKGFNEKFENIILEARRTESDRKEELARLEDRICEKRQELSRLINQNMELRQFFRTIGSIQHQIASMKDALDCADPECNPYNND